MPKSVPAGPTSTTQSQQVTASTLVIDDWLWPNGDANELNNVYQMPYPNWLEISVYQPLVAANLTKEYRDSVLQFLPCLATDWVASADGMTYTLNLRQGVKFSNGDQFNAYQVWMQLYGMYYLSANSTAWFNAYNVFDMSNVKFGPGTIAMITQSGLINPSQAALNLMMNSAWPVYVTGPYQIVFHLSAPFIWFPRLLVVWQSQIFDVQYVLDHGGFGTPGAINTYFNLNAIPGTGPYEVTTVSEYNYMALTRNPTYWGAQLSQSEIAGNPMLDPGHVVNVIINYRVDDVARYTDLDSGKAQISMIMAQDWNLVTNNPDKYAYVVTPDNGVQMNFINLNTQLYPTNIKAVRLAIVHAINYTDIIQKAWLGEGVPFVGPEAPFFKELYNLGGFQPYEYNLTLAKQYLAQANIADMPTFTMPVMSGCASCILEAQIVQGNLAQLGILVDLLVVPPSVYISPYGSYATNLQHASQLGQISILNGWPTWTNFTPADAWIWFVSNSSAYGNFAVYSNPTAQACADATMQSADLPHIQSLCSQAQAQVYNDAPYAWVAIVKLWQGSGSLVWQKGVINGFSVDPDWQGEDTAPLVNTVTFGPNAALAAIISAPFGEQSTLKLMTQTTSKLNQIRCCRYSTRVPTLSVQT